MGDDLLTSTFERLRWRLWSMARRITGNDDDAADAVQEAFCRLWQRGRQVANDGEAAGVSFTTVRHVSIDAVRRRNAHPHTELQDHDAADATTSWDEREATYAEVHAIIDSRLTEVQRRIVTLREIEGRTFDEIAQTLGTTPAAVRMQLSRARKIVRECYRRKENQQ